MTFRFFPWAALLAVAPTGFAAERLHRENLLEFHNETGEVRPVRSIPDWQRRRAEIISGAEGVMGPLPGATKRVPLDVTVQEEADCGTYVRRLIVYTSEPGSRVPGYLLVPKAALTASAPPTPAVLCLMPTNHTVGVRRVVGIGGETDSNYAQELAERGYVTIAPPYPVMANYQPDLKALGYESGTMKAIWDNIRALDLLDSLPYVKKGGYGAIGNSLGGHNSIYTALFDPRIKVVVSSCGFDSYLDYHPDRWRAGDGWAQTRYMPKILNYPREEIPFDFHELIGALAPRPIFVNAPVNDDNFKWRSVDRVMAAAAQIYQLYGAPGMIEVVHPDVGHDFPVEIRQMAYAWLDRTLR